MSKLPAHLVRLPYGEGEWARQFLHEGGPAGAPRLHRHEDLEANVVFRGEAQVVVDGRLHAFRAGELRWLLPHQWHALVSASRDFRMWVLVWKPIAATLFLTDPAVTWLRSPADSLAESVQLGARRTRELARRQRALDRGEAQSDATHLALAGLLRELAGLTAPVKAGSHRAGAFLHPAVAQVVRWFEQGEHLDLGREALAARAGLSPTRLSRLFHSQIGETLVAHRVRCRLRQVAWLARQHPEWTQLERALAAGFGSYSQYARARRQLGGA